MVNVPQPDLMKMLGAGPGRRHRPGLAVRRASRSRTSGARSWPTATRSFRTPRSASYAVRKEFLDKNRDVVVRFAMAYLHAAKEFNAAAKCAGPACRISSRSSRRTPR